MKFIEKSTATKKSELILSPEVYALLEFSSNEFIESDDSDSDDSDSDDAAGREMMELDVDQDVDKDATSGEVSWRSPHLERNGFVEVGIGIIELSKLKLPELTTAR